jgi:hypothetical protein
VLELLPSKHESLKKSQYNQGKTEIKDQFCPIVACSELEKPPILHEVRYKFSLEFVAFHFLNPILLFQLASGNLPFSLCHIWLIILNYLQWEEHSYSFYFDEVIIDYLQSRTL